MTTGFFKLFFRTIILFGAKRMSKQSIRTSLDKCRSATSAGPVRRLGKNGEEFSWSGSVYRHPEHAVSRGTIG
jgi:hypothetical protein